MLSCSPGSVGLAVSPAWEAAAGSVLVIFSPRRAIGTRSGGSGLLCRGPGSPPPPPSSWEFLGISQ